MVSGHYEIAVQSSTPHQKITVYISPAQGRELAAGLNRIANEVVNRNALHKVRGMCLAFNPQPSTMGTGEGLLKGEGRKAKSEKRGSRG
jgi:hypothetical protein